MKISILTPDLSNNCLGRAYLLAKILQRRYEIEIVGPNFGDGIWKPVASDKSITYKSVKIRSRFKPYWQIKELAKKIDGDVIYATKPLFTSFGIGLLKKIRNRKPLILDIDDWERGFLKENYSSFALIQRFKSLVTSTLFLYSMSSYWNNLFCEKLSRFACEITVSNHFLQKKFGGIIVPHGRDTNTFDPKKFDNCLIREKYQIEKTKKIVMFSGTPRAHKGIEDLVKAIRLIKNSDIILFVVGIDDRDQYCKNLVETAKKMLGERFKIFGIQPFEKVPEFLAMADVVVIPQKRNFATVGQVPAKVFDAMAMAKPIIATNVSDLPEILNGLSGLVIEPENPEQLAATIDYVLSNLGKAEKMGQKARQKCIEKYSWDSMEEILLKVFEKYE